MTVTEINTLHPAVTAADYLLSAVGREGGQIAMWALRADWMLVREAEQIELLAVALAYLLGEECPKHRGKKAKTIVHEASERNVAERIAAHLHKEGGES